MSEENRGIEEYRKRELEKQAEFQVRKVRERVRNLNIRLYSIDVMFQCNPVPVKSEAEFYGKW